MIERHIYQLPLGIYFVYVVEQSLAFPSDKTNSAQTDVTN